MYLSAALKSAGHHCDLLIEDKGPNDPVIERFAPDLIAFSVTTGMHQWALKRTTELQAKFRIPVIMGGPHATYYPEVLENSDLDFICRGEGEDAFVELVDRLENNRSVLDVKNIWAKSEGRIFQNDVRNLEDNIDSLPDPDRYLYYKYPYLRNNENKSFVASRGCPYSCTYCSIASLRSLYENKGPFLRFHSAERVIEDILEVKTRFGLRIVIFQDDTFIIGFDRLEKLLSLYRREVKLPFVCHVRADLITEDIARLLKSAGCHSVDFGLESGDEKLRSEVLGKVISDEQIREAAAVLKRAGIRFRTTNMIGLPGETLHQVYKTIQLNQSIKTDYPSASIYQPYPRTVLGDEVIASGLAGENYSVDSIGSSFFRTSLIDSKHRNQFINLQKFFWPAVRWPKLTPWIKRLVKLPPNPVFEMFFIMFYGFNYAMSEKVTLRRLLTIGRHTIRSFFFRKHI
jgi:radical SAM superfamily enzyme YgiQ (UPF0313 family)